MYKTREEYIQNIKDEELIGAELGVFEGEFSNVLKKSNKFKKIYLVDIFEGDMFSGDKNGNNGKVIDLDSSYKKLLNEYKDEDDIEIIKGRSDDFLKSLDDNTLSFVYIDADHSYDAVKNDLELSRHKVKKSGIIAGHDYNHDRFYGVFLAVNEFVKKYNLDLVLTTEDKLASYFIINIK